MTTLAQQKARKKYHKQYYEDHKEACNESSMNRYLKLKAENPEKLAEINKKAKEKKARKDTCEILKKHHKDLADDPERLSTEFLNEIIGRKCE